MNHPTTPSHVHPARQRGVALTLVLIAVTMASVLGMTFVTAQSTSLGISQSVTAYTTARNVAESGIETALAYMVTNHDWRAVQTHGAWTDDHSYGPGSYTLMFEDDDDADLANDSTDPVRITCASTYKNATHEVSIIVHMGASNPLAPVSIFGDITMGNNTVIDSFDSRLGEYDDDNSGTDAAVSSNTIDTSGVTVGNGALIEGDLNIGPNGDPSTVVDGSGSVTGTIDTLATKLVIPKIIVPDDSIVGASLGNQTLSSSIFTTNRHYGNLRLKDSLTIIGDVEMVIDGEFSMDAGTNIDITAGSSLKVYVYGNIDIQKSSTNSGFTDPSKFILFGVGPGIGPSGITYDNNSEMYLTIVAPEWPMNIKKDSDLYGTIIAASLNMEKNTEIHVDISPSLAADDIGLPTHTPIGIVWNETP